MVAGRVPRHEAALGFSSAAAREEAVQEASLAKGTGGAQTSAASTGTGVSRPGRSASFAPQITTAASVCDAGEPSLGPRSRSARQWRRCARPPGRRVASYIPPKRSRRRSALCSRAVRGVWPRLQPVWLPWCVLWRAIGCQHTCVFEGMQRVLHFSTKAINGVASALSIAKLQAASVLQPLRFSQRSPRYVPETPARRTTSLRRF